MTVKSAKARSPAHYVQGTTAIQGFSHAMVLVTVCCCPALIPVGRGLAPSLAEDSVVEDIVQHVIDINLGVSIVTARTVDPEGQVYSLSINLICL